MGQTILNTGHGERLCSTGSTADFPAGPSAGSSVENPSCPGMPTPDSDTKSRSGQEPTPPLQSTRNNSHRVETRIKPEPILRHLKTPIFLLALYLPTLIVPWVLLFILAHRPLRGSSYFDQSGKNFEGNAAGLIAANLLKTINAVLAVPILSTLLAHAAVVYAMRRRDNQKLNVLQLFTLADKGWTNIVLLWDAISPAKDNADSSSFLWLAAVLVALGAVLQPLTSLLISTDATAVTTCLDIPITGCSEFGPPIVGYDPEPADMPFIQPDLILQDVLGQIGTVSDLEAQPNLWPVNPDLNAFADGKSNPVDRQTFSAYAPNSGYNPDGFFVTSLVNGTNTGVLREHALRLNSSAHCQLISRSEYPSSCPGASPFITHIQRDILDLRICVLGNTSVFPFTPSRNRQDITEEMYVDLEVFPNTYNPNIDAANFTTHCVASTSRGYFELGNIHNQYVYGSLLEEWPTPQYIVQDTNDYRGLATNYSRPATEDPSTATNSEDLEFIKYTVSPFDDWNPLSGASVPGPLMVSAEVLFGNYSFVRFLADNTTNMTSIETYTSVCEGSRFPLSQVIGLISLSVDPWGYCSDTVDNIEFLEKEGAAADQMSMLLLGYTQIFNATQDAEYALMIIMYFANRAILTKTISAEGPFQRRNIYSASGTIFNRPSISLSALIVITILILLQVTGLAIVTLFIYSMPTWASSLDAWEVARIAQAFKGIKLPPIGPVDKKALKQLLQTDALIGIQEEKWQGNDTKEGHAEPEIQQQAATGSTAEVVAMGEDNTNGAMQLMPGGKGVITRRVAKTLAKSKQEIQEDKPLI
ncbi:hypothetical protein F5Y16DRAFT_387995 [Xylariaceae sp. FL0255]|nr:hypothetical protein F5Y16DRAFT_387995 [Xylariaceae sp. FL0255]